MITTKDPSQVKYDPDYRCVSDLSNLKDKNRIEKKKRTREEAAAAISVQKQEKDKYIAHPYMSQRIDTIPHTTPQFTQVPHVLNNHADMIPYFIHPSIYPIPVIPPQNEPKHSPKFEEKNKNKSHSNTKVCTVKLI